MYILKRINDGLAKIEGWALVVLVIVMVSLSFLQVILRNFFQTGIIWADPFNRHLVLWVGFFGASLAAYKGKHITIDILSRLVPVVWKPVINILINSVGIYVCWILTKASFEFVQMEKEGGAILFLNIPTYIVEIILPLGFALITFRFFMHLTKSVYAVYKRGDA